MLVRSIYIYIYIIIYIWYIITFLIYRHPETLSRPTFVDLVSDLSQPDFKLLQTETDTCLGAQLDTAHNLYPELQKIYIG